MKHSILLFLSLFCCYVARGMDPERIYDLKTYSVNEGLSQFSAGKVIQDSYGFIWIITWDGLNRFDGNGFVKYRHDPFDPASLSGNRVLDILIDRNRDLWVVIENGFIERYDYLTDRFEHYEFGPLKQAIVTAFYQDAQGRYWMGTTNGLYRTRLAGSEFVVDRIVLHSDTPGLENHVMTLAENNRGEIWIGTTSGLYVLDPDDPGESAVSGFLEGFAVNDLYEDPHGALWICCDQGLGVLPEGVFHRAGGPDRKEFRFIPGLEEGIVRKLIGIDPDYGIVFTFRAPLLIHFGTKQYQPLRLSDPGFFEGNLATSVLKDHTDNIWVSSLFKGVAKIDLMQQDDPVGKKSGTQGLFIKSVFRDSRDRVWIGTNFQGLYYYDADGVVRSMPVEGLEPSYMFVSTSIIEDRYGNIWFSLNSELYVFDYATGKVSPAHRAYPGDRVTAKPFSLASDRFGRIWAGCSDGLVRIDLENRRLRAEPVPIGNLSDMVSSEQISRLLYDPIHNMVWSCSKNDGVSALFLDGNGEVAGIQNLLCAGDRQSLSSNHVWSVAVSPDSTVWFGTDSGLNRCRVSGRSLSVAPLPGSQKVRNLKIMSLADDGQGNLWIGTSEGLYTYQYDTGAERLFTINNGLYANAVLEGMFIDGQELYAGTINGLNIVPLSAEPSHSAPAEAIITDFRIYGQSVKRLDRSRRKLDKSLFDAPEIVLGYDENNFTIDFLALHYNNFDDNTYFYQLEGYDPDSLLTDSRNRSVTYNRLPPGKYRFWVKASNNGNEWTGGKQYLTVRIKPAPWLSGWAFLAYAAALFLILYFVYHYLSKKERYERELRIGEIENKRKEEIRAMQFRFHSNIAHDIRTPITLISAPLEDILEDRTVTENPFVRERVEIIDKNVSRLLYLVNQFLQYNEGNTFRPERHPVRREIGQITSLFHGVALSRKIHYECVLDINNEELVFDADQLAKILINLISNAFKATPPKGDIYVFIEQQNEELILKVQDSGHGIPSEKLHQIFERFYQVKRTPGEGSGIGLALVKQLVELCGGRIEVQSTEGQGSQFTVTIPVEIPENEEPEAPAETGGVPGAMSGGLPGGSEGTGENPAPSNRHIILIVEDDPDLRQYLSDCFKDDYTVVKASDGQKGFDQALRYTPDVILTDLAMPKLDGIALIRLIRSDHRTSHIPILVLATRSEGSEVRALEAGAEDFIHKPFSSKALRLKVENYLRRFSKNPAGAGADPKPGETVAEVGVKDQEFLNRMNDILSGNLDDPTFSIEFICEKLAISRMQLHRKMVALLNKSTSEYIREFKLDRARKYFEEGEVDVEAVMVKVGLTSYFHFNKNFKNRFGLSIKEFIEQR